MVIKSWINFYIVLNHIKPGNIIYQNRTHAKFYIERNTHLHIRTNFFDINSNIPIGGSERDSKSVEDLEMKY